MKLRFEIPYPPSDVGRREWTRLYGLNGYYGNRVNYHERTRAIHVLHELVQLRMRKAGIPKQAVTEPVTVTFHWNDRLDIDNHAIMGKAIVDAMKGWVLPDDNRRWLVGVSHRFWDGEDVLVEVETAVEDGVEVKS